MRQTIKIGASVILTEAEQDIAEYMAHKRQNANVEQGVASKKMTVKATDLQIHTDGFGAELAFARLANVYVDFTTHIRGTKTDVGDVRLHNGRSVDVKHTTLGHGNLIVPARKIAEIDYYVLMVGRFPKYEFRGCLPREKFFVEENLTDFCFTGRKDTYFARQETLEDLEIVAEELMLPVSDKVSAIFFYPLRAS